MIPTPGEAKTGHDFVKNQHRAVLCREVPEELQKSLFWENQARVGRDRLKDESRDLVPMLREDLLDQLGAVERNRNRESREIRRNPRAVGLAEGERPAPRRD